MALTKISRSLLDTGVSDSSDATAITIDSSENVTFAGGLIIPSTITHDGDTDTKLDFNQANTLRLITGDNTAWVCNASSMVINEDSIDFDFRVESNGNANMLFVDGGKNSVGIGTTPEAHYTGYVGLDIGAVASLFSNASGTNITTLTNNGFLNSDASNWVYKVTDEATMYSQVHGDHRFSTAASGSADAAITWSEKVRFQNAGGISFNGDTAAANALDDYEEGTWTPTFQGATLSTAVGNYTKIGNQVTVHYTVVTTGGLPSSGTQVQVGGLPFTQNSGNLSAGSVYARYYTPNDSTLTMVVQDGESAIRYVNINEDSFDYTVMGELEASANNSIYTIGTITYIV